MLSAEIFFFCRDMPHKRPRLACGSLAALPELRNAVFLGLFEGEEYFRWTPWYSGIDPPTI